MAVTLYVVVYASSATQPSAAQIKSGLNGDGGAATWAAGSGSGVAWTGTGQQVTASGLTAGTSYKASAVTSDGSSDSNVVHSDAFFTTRTLSADAGSYALSGQTATITISRSLALDAGSYAVTGHDATLTVSRSVSFDSGSYSVTGRDATLSYTPLGQFALSCDAGSYALTGHDATLIVSRALSLDAGSYTVTGNDATLTKGITIALDAGSYTLTGRDITTSRSYAIDLEAGSYTLNAIAADLSYSGAPPPEPTPVKRGAGGSRFVEARKRLPMPFLIDWLTNEEPTEETKRVITEIKAGRPIPRDAKPPKGPENISAERLAREILPYRAFQFETYLSDLVFASRTIEKAVSIARERDDEDILLLL